MWTQDLLLLDTKQNFFQARQTPILGRMAAADKDDGNNSVD